MAMDFVFTTAAATADTPVDGPLERLCSTQCNRQLFQGCRKRIAVHVERPRSDMQGTDVPRRIRQRPRISISGYRIFHGVFLGSRELTLALYQHHTEVAQHAYFPRRGRKLRYEQSERYRCG
jgi:hypothetical protein